MSQALLQKVLILSDTQASEIINFLKIEKIK